MSNDDEQLPSAAAHPEPTSRDVVVAAVHVATEIAYVALSLVMIDMFTGGHLRRGLLGVVARLDQLAHRPEVLPAPGEVSALLREAVDITKNAGGAP